MTHHLDGHGMLWIERRGKLRQQHCPYLPRAPYSLTQCGDWCPLLTVTDGRITLCNGKELECD